MTSSSSVLRSPVRNVLAGALCVWLVGCAGRPAVADRNGDGVITVYCLGDSNTDPAWSPDIPKWCELVAAELPTMTFVNGGYAWTKAAGRDGFTGAVLLEAALEAHPIDLVIVSLGTNDMDADPRLAVEGLMAIRRQAEAGGVDTLIATIPPVFNDDAARIEHIAQANAMLAGQVAPDHLVDFTSGMTRDDCTSDGVHILASGQRKRAAAVVRALWAL